MILFGDIGNFFKNAANKVSSTIIKPIGRFVSHTIPDVAGKVISAIKSGGSKAIELGGQVVDKGKEVVAGVIDSASKLVDKVNPLNNIGFYVVLGLGVFVLIEFPFRSCCSNDGYMASQNKENVCPDGSFSFHLSPYNNLVQP